MRKIWFVFMLCLCQWSVFGQTIEMVLVEGGTFKMGSEKGDEDERPIHSVTLSDFYIGKYEITQKEWTTIMGTGMGKKLDCENCPIDNVTWNEAQEFISKLNAKTGQKYRLPTEAEWEYAARGGKLSKNFPFVGANNPEEICWYARNSGDSILLDEWDWDKMEALKCRTHPVGKKQANELGIYDMNGNVWEWCVDWYDKDYYAHCPQENPQGASSGTERVLRGGSWRNPQNYLRVTFRYNDRAPVNMMNVFGFRLAKNK